MRQQRRLSQQHGGPCRTVNRGDVRHGLYPAERRTPPAHSSSPLRSPAWGGGSPQPSAPQSEPRAAAAPAWPHATGLALPGTSGGFPSPPPRPPFRFGPGPRTQAGLTEGIRPRTQSPHPCARRRRRAPFLTLVSAKAPGNAPQTPHRPVSAARRLSHPSTGGRRQTGQPRSERGPGSPVALTEREAATSILW